MTDEHDRTNISGLVSFMVTIPVVLIGFFVLWTVMSATEIGSPNIPFASAQASIIGVIQSMFSLLPILAAAGLILFMLKMLFSTDDDTHVTDSTRIQGMVELQYQFKGIDGKPLRTTREKNWFARQLTRTKSEKQPKKSDEWVIKKL